MKSRDGGRPVMRFAIAALGVSLGACDARIGEPRALWALWMLPALVVFYLLSLRSRSAGLRRFASASMIGRLTAGASARRSVFRASLVTLAVIAMLVSLCRLQMGYTWEEVERRGVDIVIALDVSDSMRVEDAGRELSRLERAKREIQDLLQLLQGDRVGIVAFAGTAFVQCPMTLDYGAAELFLDALDTQAIPVQGTDLAQALETSLAAFKGSAAGSRAILLITDGEDHSGRAVEVAQRLGAEGVRVFVIGIGTEEGAPIPADRGGFRRDRRGDIILSRLDERTLQQVALATEGRYVRSVTGDLDLEQIYVEGIKATLEDREIEAHRRQRWEDRFQWLLAAALGALMIEGLVPERASVRRRQRGSLAVAGRAGSRRSTAETSSPGAVSATLALALLVIGSRGARGQAEEKAGPAAAGTETGDTTAKAAPSPRFDTPEEAYEAGDFAQALEGFVDLQVERPEDAAVAMNVGSTRYRLGDLDEAVRSFEAAGAGGDDRLRAQAWYDIGNAAYRQGRLEEAIESYHRSLDLDPRDGDAKFNLEVTQGALERREKQKQDSSGDPQQKPQQGGDEQSPPEQDGSEPSPQNGGEESAQDQQASSNDPGPKNEGDPRRDGDGERQPQRDPRDGRGEGASEGDAAPDGAAADEKRGATEGRMTAAEAQRLLDAIEEGRPRRRVPPGRHRDQEKDW